MLDETTNPQPSEPPVSGSGTGTSANTTEDIETADAEITVKLAIA